MKHVQGIVLLFIFINVYPQQDTCLILSEIMFIPQPGNNEFIEIYNSSTTDTFNLSNFKIKYYTAAADVFTDAGWGTLLPPLCYAVVLEGDYDFVSGIYNNLIPAEALKIKISDNAFGATGMANTSDRLVQFIRPSSEVIDQRLYSADNTAGYSEEKITAGHDSLDSNWSNSEIFNGTPGKRNSVSRLEYDIAAAAIYKMSPVPVAGEVLTIKAVIKNKGLNTAAFFNCSFYNDINLDSIPSPSELFSTYNYFNLGSGDSILSETGLLLPLAGIYNIIAKLHFEEDEDTLNNIAHLLFTVYQGNELCDLVINELMYAPSGGMPEWMELYNRSGDAVNLRNRKISDNTSSVYITRMDLFLPADSFVVLSKDSSILNFYTIPSLLLELPSLPSLNNSGDDIVIKDSAGVHFDSLSYLPEWGGTGSRSLERKSSEVPTNSRDNWGTSVGMYKGTPGWINSITDKDNDLNILSFAALLSYGIIGEGIDINVVIKNSGTSVSGNYSLKIYYDINKDSIPQVQEQINVLSGPPLQPSDSASYIFSFSGYSIGSNHLITVAEVNPDDDLTNNTGFTKFTGVLINEIRGDIIINEFIYAPSTPEPEWIEIYNNSNKTIELKNYLIADSHDSVKINSDLLSLYPEEYLIIASDSSILNHYTIGTHLLVSNFPSLNNTGDKIILLDSLERVIDSLEYKTGWGNTGKSLERIAAGGSSTDSTNWNVCLSKNNGTPGYINSVTQKEYDLRVISVQTIPRYPVKGDNVEISACIRNNGSSSMQFLLSLYIDNNIDSIPDALIESLPDLFLQGYDSSTYTFRYRINDLNNDYNFYIIAEAENDQDTSNNYKFTYIFPGYSPGAVVINEIMYAPEGGEPEWIEVFNRMDIPADISHWEISDVYSSPVRIKLQDEIFIPPHEYFVISKDSTIRNYHRLIPSGFITAELPVMNNDIDGIIIKDNRGQTMDSLIYNTSWGGKSGYSLERISLNAVSTNPFNWKSSRDIEKSTPGRINSSAPKEYDLGVSGISFNPRFPVKGDDVSVSAQIKNFGTLNAETAVLNFYLINYNGGNDSLLSSIVFNDLEPDDSVCFVSSGSIHEITSRCIIKAEVIFQNDIDTFNNVLEKSVEPGIASSTIIINEIMHTPAAGEPEWIEFINLSEDSINMKDWVIEDISSGQKNIITVFDFYLHTDEYFIITSDSIFSYYFPDLNCKVITLNMPALGNNNDGIVLYDFRKGIVDSVLYQSSWGGSKAYSLERIFLNKLSEDSSNWASCLNPSKSTPGRENSVTGIKDYRRNELIINEILADPDIDNCEFIEFLNTTGDTINVGGWRIQDEKGNFNKLCETTFTVPPSALFVMASDSIIYLKYLFKTECFISIVNLPNMGLTNSGELILLKDVKGNVIDSIVYSDKWHNKSISSTKNISLERINPSISGNEKSNWSSSLSHSGATPAEMNSIHCVNPFSGSGISVSPNPFSPDNDGYEDHCIINYKLMNPVAQLRIKIFDSQGRIVRTVVTNSASGNTGSVIFDGFNDEGQSLRMGIYIIFLEAVNEYSTTPEVLKTVVVVARKLD